MLLSSIVISRKQILFAAFILGLAITTCGCENDPAVNEIRSKYSGPDKKVTVFSAVDGQKLHFLKHLKKFDELTHLKIGGKGITAEHVRQISEIPNLEILSIKVTDLSGADLLPLAKLEKLKRLELNAMPNLDDTVIEHICKLKLTDLKIYGCLNFQGKNLDRLLGNNNLVYLNLSGTKVDDEVAVTIGKMSQLKLLDVTHTNITENGVRAFLTLTQLDNYQGPDLPKAKAIEYAKIAIANRQKARAEGKTTAPDQLSPYAAALTQ